MPSTIIALLLILHFAVIGAVVPPLKAPQTREFGNFDKEYKITFPENWRWKQNFMGLDVFAEAPETNIILGSRANMSLISFELSEGESLDSFVLSNENELFNALQDYKIIERSTAILDNMKSKKIVYIFSGRAEEKETKIRVAQYFLVRNGRGVMITCSAENRLFLDYVPIFEQSLRTLKLL